MNLGSWLTPGAKLRRRRQSYITRNPLCAYHWISDCYWLCTRIDHASREFSPVKPTNWTPTNRCYPVTFTKSEAGMLSLHNILDSPPPVVRHHVTIIDFLAYVATLPSWERQHLQGVRFHKQPYEIVQSLISSSPNMRLLMVSDGSHKDSTMTYGWVFGSGNQDIYVEHSGEGASTATSHRAEAWRMLSATLFVYHLHRYTGTSRNIQIQDTPLSFVIVPVYLCK